MKKLLYVFFLIILILSCSSIVYSQDDSEEGDFIIDIIIFVSDGDIDSLYEEQTISEININELLEELRYIASIHEEERTIAEWKRIIQIVLLISYSNANITEEYYQKILEYITKAKELTKKNKLLTEENQRLLAENNVLIEENKILIFQNQELIDKNNELLIQIEIIKEKYENDITNLLLVINEYENTIPHYNTLFISPSINLNGRIDLGVGYMTNINWFVIGGGIDIGIRPFSIGFFVNLGISF